MVTCGLGIRASLCSQYGKSWSGTYGRANFFFATFHNCLWAESSSPGLTILPSSGLSSTSPMLTNSATLFVFLIFSNFFATIVGQYASDFPSPMPMVIKSPYFNFWLPSDSNLTTPGGRLPAFYTGSNVSWTGYIRVDGTGYNFQGNNSNYTTTRTVDAYITPTRTIFTIEAGSVRLNLTYLSPIEPADWKLHSFPFAYMAIDVWSTDSQPHHVQIYSDVSGHFVSSNSTSTITWNTTQTSESSIYHRVQRTSIESLTENRDMSEDGVLYFGTRAATNLTWQTGAFYEAQSGFLVNGSLNNSSDTSHRSISSNTPVMSFALDLGNITSTANPIVFTLGLVRDPVLTYLRGGSAHDRKPLWLSKWSSVDAGINNFLSSYSSALSRAVTLDTKIMSDAANLSLSSNSSSLYQNLVALNLRQTIGALEFTTSILANGTLAGTSDVRVFMKDVGNSQRVNPVEGIYAAFPAFLYMFPPVAGALLEPLLEFQMTPSLYSHGFAAPDLGSSWPHVNGNNTDQSAYAIENCGSMLVMALAHARKSGKGWLIHRYYTVLETWANYLVTNGLQPNGSSLASDNIPETSNLALKAIMGIYAMGNINQILEDRGADPAKTKHYLDTATSYAKQWESLAFSYDHITSTYGSNASWSFLYNLYLPKLLGAGIFSQNIYDAQAAWYAAKLASTDSFGLGYDSNDPNTAKAHWTLLTAGSVYNTTSGAARDVLINKAAARPFFKNIQNKPNPSTYTADFGKTLSGISSPVLGASFALLALNVPDQSSITLPSGTLMGSVDKPNSHKRSKILGGTLGTLAGLIIIGLIFFFLRRRRGAQRTEEREFEKPIQSPSLVENSPINPTTIAHVSTGDSKAQLLMTYDDGGPSTVSPSSESGSPAAGEGSSPSDSNQQQQQMRLVPQRAAHLHVTNLAPGEEKQLPSPGMTPVPQSEGRAAQDENLRREVERLRVEMEAIRVGQQLNQQPRVSEEPPPGYAES